MKTRALSYAVYGLTTLIGVLAFLYPFWLPVVQASGQGLAHSNDASLLLTLLVALTFVVLLLEVQSQSISAKTIALLGVLVAINAALRFVDVAMPGPGGFSPIFFLIVLTGYVYGGRFGFLMGVLTLVVSSLFTGTIGPWLPYQMVTAGWIGLTAPLCRPLVRAVDGAGRWPEVVILAVFGGVWGLLYGAIMNIWFWPFVSGTPDQYWAPGTAFVETLRRYALFYAATSLVWDVMRLVGNSALIIAFALPTLRVLRRFQARFDFVYQPWERPVARLRPTSAQQPLPVPALDPFTDHGD